VIKSNKLPRDYNDALKSFYETAAAATKTFAAV